METVVITVVTCMETYDSRHVHGDCCFYNCHVDGDLLQSSRAWRLLLLQLSRGWRLITVVTCMETVVTTIVTWMETYYSCHLHGDLLLQSSVRCFWRPWQTMFFAYSPCYVRRSWTPSHGIVQEASWRTVEPNCSRAPFCFNHVLLRNCGTHDVLTCLCTSDMWFFPENNIHWCDL